MGLNKVITDVQYTSYIQAKNKLTFRGQNSYNAVTKLNKNIP